MKFKRLIYYLPYLLIGFVFVINIQAGIQFYFQPSRFAYAYELNGIPGNIATAGTGLLFLMWNVPYAFALSNPYHQRTSLLQAVIMQAIGVIGESILYGQIPKNQHLILQQSIKRFIMFDGIGLVLLTIAFWIVLRSIKKTQV